MAEPFLAIEQPVRLRSIEAFILSVHGGVRNLTTEESLVMRRWVNQIVAYIKENWPVDTRTSRDLWTSTASIGIAGSVGFTIENPMHYARWVHRSGTPVEPRLHTVLIPEAISQFIKQLMTDLKIAIIRTEQELSERAAATQAERLVAMLGQQGEQVSNAEAFRNTLLELTQLRPLSTANLTPVGGP